MRQIDGVVSVHDLHIWTITSGFVAMSAHVLTNGRPSAPVLQEVQTQFRERFSIEHTTLQVEEPDHREDGARCTIDPRCLMVSPPASPAAAGPVASVDEVIYARRCRYFASFGRERSPGSAVAGDGTSFERWFRERNSRSHRRSTRGRST